MSQGIAERFGNVLVKCPMPGMEHEPAQRLDEFMATEVGQKVLGPSLANVEILLGSGMKEDQAVSIAFGAAIVRDEDGGLQRAPESEESSRLALASTEESKKKF